MRFGGYGDPCFRAVPKVIALYPGIKVPFTEALHWAGIHIRSVHWLDAIAQMGISSCHGAQPTRARGLMGGLWTQPSKGPRGFKADSDEEGEKNGPSKHENGENQNPHYFISR